MFFGTAILVKTASFRNDDAYSLLHDDDSLPPYAIPDTAFLHDTDCADGKYENERAQEGYDYRLRSLTSLPQVPSPVACMQC